MYVVVGCWCGMGAGMAAVEGDLKEQTVLATDRQARMPVVVSAKASDATKSVAAELAGYLGRITNAEFEVKAGDGVSGIFLGTIAEFPDAAIAAPLEIRETYGGREAFVIRSETGRVRLIGATDLGASHAAFRFLELLGCRCEVTQNGINVSVEVPKGADGRFWHLGNMHVPDG